MFDTSPEPQPQKDVSQEGHSLLDCSSAAAMSQTAPPTRQQTTQQEEQQAGALASMLGAVFSRLAALVPSLTELHLNTPCLHTTLHAFGARCLHLTKLRVDAATVPAQALRGFGQHMPHLTSLTICSCDDNQGEVRRYMDAALCEAQHCSNLKSLALNMNPFITLECAAESWGELPTSLQDLHCSCTVTPSDGFDALVRRLPQLSLHDCPVNDFLELVLQFPVLEALTASAHDQTGPLQLWCIDFRSATKRAVLQERLKERPLCLSCAIGVEGTCAELFDVLGWLPPFPHVSNVTVDFVEDQGWEEGEAQVENQQLLLPENQFQVSSFWRLAQIFPAAASFTLTGQVGWQDGPVRRDLDLLAPLSSFSSLTSLDICAADDLTVTVAELTQLALSLPNLTRLKVDLRLKMDTLGLQEGLKSLGRSVAITSG